MDFKLDKVDVVNGKITYTVDGAEVVEELTQYEGNKVTYISPYTFFPDPSVKLADFQKGAFCATEQSEPLINVKQKEGSLYHGTKLIRNE
jgi:hypothetical protein